MFIPFVPICRLLSLALGLTLDAHHCPLEASVRRLSLSQGWYSLQPETLSKGSQRLSGKRSLGGVRFLLDLDISH